MRGAKVGVRAQSQGWSQVSQRTEAGLVEELEKAHMQIAVLTTRLSNFESQLRDSAVQQVP